MAAAHRNFIYGQDTKVVQIRFAVLVLQKLLVNSFDRFPVQVQMVRDFTYRHYLAQLINIEGQAFGHSNIRIKQFQVLNTDLSAYRAEQFPVTAIEPHLS